MQLAAIVLLTFRELWAKKIVIGLFIISTLIWVMLAFALKHRYSTVAVFTGFLVILIMLIMSGWTRFVMFERLEGETATAEFTFEG